MTIRVLFFGLVREIAGRSEEIYEAAPGMTAGQLLADYASRYPPLAALRGSVLVAVNQEFVGATHVLSPGDEAALLPPVSGGTDDHYFALTRQPIDSLDVAARVVRPTDGAAVTFQGVTRNNTKGRATLHLEYEGYEPMALKVMSDMGRDIALRHAVSRIGIVHRLGRLEIGETSVVIVVASPHRKAAFAACEEAIDTLKQRVPIWKKEFFGDGEVWVEGHWDESLRSL